MKSCLTLVANFVPQHGSGYRSRDDGAMIAGTDLFPNYAAENAARNDRQCPR